MGFEPGTTEVLILAGGSSCCCLAMMFIVISVGVMVMRKRNDGNGETY